MLNLKFNDALNMRAVIIILSFFIIAFLLSCETYIDIEVPPIEQKPVLNCLFTENEAFKVRLSLSMDVNDTSETKIEAAQISLFANGEFIEELADSGKGFYKSNHIAQMGTQYRIEANINGFKTLTASDSLPQMISPENVYYKKNSIPDAYGNSYAEANISINDPANKNNYYEILLSCIYINQWYDPDFNGYEILIKDNIAYWMIDDPVIGAEEIVGWIGSIPFLDELFNGKEYLL